MTKKPIRIAVYAPLVTKLERRKPIQFTGEVNERLMGVNLPLKSWTMLQNSQEHLKAGHSYKNLLNNFDRWFQDTSDLDIICGDRDLTQNCNLQIQYSTLYITTLTLYMHSRITVLWMSVMVANKKRQDISEKKR